MKTATLSTSLLLLLGLILAACGGGGGSAAGSGGKSHTGDPILDALKNLAAPIRDEPRVDDRNHALGDDYSPLGGRRDLDRKDELVFFGTHLGGDDEARTLFLFDDFGEPGDSIYDGVLASYPNDADWLFDQRPDVDAAPQTKRHGTAADLDGNGLEELVIGHVVGSSLLLEVTWDSTRDYAQETLDVDGMPDVEEIQLAAGDFDGDGAQEVAVATDLAGAGELRVYDCEDGVFVRTFIRDLPHVLPESRAFFSIAAGNLDNDFRDELALVMDEVAWTERTASMLVLDDARARWATLRDGAVVDPTDDPAEDALVVADVALGDIDGDGRDELVFAGISATAALCEGEHRMFALDDHAHGFESLGAHTGTVGSSPCASVDARPIAYVHANAGDVDGDGYAEVQVAHQVYDDWAAAEPWTARWSIDVSHARADGNRAYDRSTSAMVMGDFTGDGRTDLAEMHQSSTLGERGIFVWGLQQPGEYPPAEEPQLDVRQLVGAETSTHSRLNLVLIAVNTDVDSPVLRYDAGEHELIYTEPIVLAVLAAPPTQTAIPQNLEGSSTAFGKTTSSGEQAERSATVSASISVGASFDGGVLTQSEAKLKLTVGVASTQLTGHAYELSHTVIFEAAYNEDKVVLTTIPVDTYTYTVMSHPDPALVGQKLVVRLPRTPITFQAERDYYNENIHDGGIRIDERIFRHRIGDPDSYTTAAEKDAILAARGGLEEGPQAVGVGYSAETRELVVSESWSHGGALEMSYSFEAEATAGGVLGGYSIGANVSDSLVVTSGQQTSYTARVGDLDPAAFVPGEHQYSFGIFTYVHTDPRTGRQLEVIDYWVE